MTVRPPDELIVAPATVATPSLRAIVRLAGAEAVALLKSLVEPVAGAWPPCLAPPRCLPACFREPGLVATFGRVPCEVLVWPGLSGPLGGPLAEIQLPGAIPLVEAVVETVCRLGGRLARGGEFTLRSFLAGRIDLVQAEAVLAVIDARSPEQLTAALDAAAGGIGRRLEATRERLLDLVADVEAMIDFGEESTVAGQPMHATEPTLMARLDGLRAELDLLSTQLGERAAAATVGMPRVVLAGAANIGKSSLFNALAGHAASIVADEPGTTRDWVQAEIEGPIPYLVIDLAGLEDEDARREAVAVARRERARADLVIACSDAAAGVASGGQHDGPENGPMSRAEPGDANTSATIPVWTRVDRVEGRSALPGERLATSGRTGEGVERLRIAIEQALQEIRRSDMPATLRMATALAASSDALSQGSDLLAAGGPVDEVLLAAHLGWGLRHLDEAIGRELGNDLLDRLFARHCIGK